MEFQFRVNFLSSTKTETPLPLLFVARMMVIFLLWVRGMENILPPFLPFIQSLDALRGASWLFQFLDWVYWVSLVMVFAGIRFRFFSLVIGLLIFASVLFSKVQFSNSFLYSGCIFFLIGIFKPSLEWIFRIQISLLYLGAGLNKLFDPDWLSGQYFDFFFTKPYPNQFYIALASLFPLKSLAIILSFFTIVTELGFGVWAIINKRKVLLVALINLFHLGMLLLTAGALSYIFFYLMAVSSYLILPWGEKQRIEIQYPEKSKFFSFLKFLDFDRFFRWQGYFEENTQKFHFWNWKKVVCSYFGKLIFHQYIFGILVLVVVFVSMYRNHILNFVLRWLIVPSN